MSDIIQRDHTHQLTYSRVDEREVEVDLEENEVVSLWAGETRVDVSSTQN